MPNPSNLSAIKAATQSKTRIVDDQTLCERDALVLILAHLQSRGFLETACTLIRESMSLKLYEQADNLDLVKVLKEYEQFHDMKYGKRPVFSKPVQHEISNDALVNRKHDIRSKRKHSTPIKQHPNSATALPPLNFSVQLPSSKRSNRKEGENDEKCTSEGVTGFAINFPSKSKAASIKTNPTDQNEGSLKPLPHFGGDVELRSLALSIRHDIIQTSPNISWNDIVDLNGEFACYINE